MFGCGQTGYVMAKVAGSFITKNVLTLLWKLFLLESGFVPNARSEKWKESGLSAMLMKLQS